MVTDEIIKACLVNDRSAQKQLYKLLAAKLFACCNRYTRNRQEAEDWLQDGFVKIFQNLSSFKFEGSFEGWSKRIVTNHILSELRKSKRLGSVSDLDSVSEIRETHDSPQDAILIEELTRFINLLPDGKKLVFNLYVLEGYSHKEIADLLSITEGASRGQLAKAREQLIEIHRQQNKINVNTIY